MVNQVLLQISDSYIMQLTPPVTYYRFDVGSTKLYVQNVTPYGLRGDLEYCFYNPEQGNKAS